ncbi:MAG: hypothetical protein H6823_22620 [Planctomycetaceae bacterium]|nr:hypothetical protein [Planctomycetaceae bacterium]
MHEGDYEVRLEQDESVWASREERDNMLTAIDALGKVELTSTTNGGKQCPCLENDLYQWRETWLLSCLPRATRPKAVRLPPRCGNRTPTTRFQNIVADDEGMKARVVDAPFLEDSSPWISPSSRVKEVTEQREGCSQHARQVTLA